MTPYQFFMVKEFPKFTRAKREISTQVQMTLTGTPETVHTIITPVQESYKDGFERLNIETGIRRQVSGYTYVPIEGRLQKKEFTEYVQSVDFRAFLNRDMKVLILKASHKVANGFLNNIKKGDTGITLLNPEIDFDKVHNLYPEFIAAWFQKISPNVKSLGMSGISIEHTTQFKQCLALGVISALGMEYPYEGQKHPFILGRRCSVTFYRSYVDSLVHESRIVTSIFEDVVSKTWIEKKTGKKEVEPPTVIEPDFHDIGPGPGQNGK